MKQMLSTTHILIILSMVISLLGAGPVVSAQGPTPGNPPPPDGGAGAPEGTSKPAAVPPENMIVDQKVRQEFQSMLDLEYQSVLYTHSDLILFSYAAGTYFEVLRADGSLFWSGTLAQGRHAELSPGAGVYLVGATQAFSVNVGDSLTDFVWGYYAMDQAGKGLSKLFYTYQANWYGWTDYDPHFIVFAYENATSVQVRNTTTGTLIWSGTLNEGQHYDNRTLSNVFVTVSSSKPVSALSYTDQGYYVPAENGTFAGRKFYTFAGNAGGWAEDVNLVAYENANITVRDTTTGGAVWSGYLSAGQVKTIANYNSHYLTVRSTGNIAVSVSPSVSYSSSYYHALYIQDSTGTGIGTEFTFPAIASSYSVYCRMILFSYEDGSNITVEDGYGYEVWNGTLNYAESAEVSTQNTTYSVHSLGKISILYDCGDTAGADFAPVYYSILNLQVLSPVGETYTNGATMPVSVRATYRSLPILGANLSGRINLNTPGDAIEMTLEDTGRNGDATAYDGIYSARTVLPGESIMPPDNYFIQVSATAVINDRVTAGGSTSIFTVSGSAQGSLNVDLSYLCPSGAVPIAGEECTFSATVRRPDTSPANGATVSIIVYVPGGRQEVVTLQWSHDDVWTGTYTMPTGGQYFFDMRADPAGGEPYISGYASRVVDVLSSSIPLFISIDEAPSQILTREAAEVQVRVTNNGQPVSDAQVTGLLIQPMQMVDFVNIGNGYYAAMVSAETPGYLTLSINARSPMYLPAYEEITMTVLNNSATLANGLDSYQSLNSKCLEKMRTDVWHIAQDGDWFRRQKRFDQNARTITFMIDLISLGIAGDDYVLELKNAALKNPGVVKSQFLGLNAFDWLHDQADSTTDGRIYRSWATRLQKSIQEAIEDGKLNEYLLKGELPPGVGYGTINRAMVYYSAQMTAQSMDDAAKTAFRRTIINRWSVEENFLKEILYPIFSESLTEDVDDLTVYTGSIKANLPPSPDPSEVDAYLADLKNRTIANCYFSKDIEWKSADLWNAQDWREMLENEPWWKEWVSGLWKTALPIVAGAIWGGPVGAGVGVVIASYDLINHYAEASVNITQDDLMAGYAEGAMNSSFNTKEDLKNNTVGGLVNIRRGTVPVVPDGEIVSIEHQKAGSSFWFLFFEKQAYTRITIKNTGPVEASYNIRTYYTRLTNKEPRVEYLWQGSMVDPQTMEALGQVKLQPEEEREVLVLYKNTDQGLDMRPGDGDHIFFVLTALSGYDLYFASAKEETFQPTIDLANSPHAAAAEAVDGEVTYPFTSQLAILPGSGRQYSVLMTVSNPFGYPLTATVSSEVPESLTLVNPGGGLFEGNRLQWRRIIQPHESYTFQYTVINETRPGVSITLPAPAASIYMPDINQEAVFDGVPLTILPRFDDIHFAPMIRR